MSNKKSRSNISMKTIIMLPNELIYKIIKYVDEPLLIWHIFGWSTFLQMIHSKLIKELIVLRIEKPYYLIRKLYRTFSRTNYIICESDDPKKIKNFIDEITPYIKKTKEELFEQAISTNNWNSYNTRSGLFGLFENPYMIISKNYEQGFNGWNLYYPPFIPEYTSDDDEYNNDWHDYTPINAELDKVFFSSYDLLNGEIKSDDEIYRITPRKKTYPDEYGILIDYKLKEAKLFDEEIPFLKKHGLY